MLSKVVFPDPDGPATAIFLFTDGEEIGSLGAYDFVQNHPWSKDVKFVINMEARGVSGASLMFETGADNLWLIKIFSKVISRPFTSSLFETVYRR